jgi:hypothetical protein
LSLCQIPRELIAQENESARHERGIRRKSMSQEATLHAPITQSNEDCRQSEDLPDLHSNVEADYIRDQTTLRQSQFLKLGGQSKPVE